MLRDTHLTNVYRLNSIDIMIYAYPQIETFQVESTSDGRFSEHALRERTIESRSLVSE